MRTVAHLYDNYANAETVVRELESAGFTHDQVSLLANQQTSSTTGTSTSSSAQAAGTGVGTGASLGTIVGGGAGL